jgi:hypothetical protein
MKLTYDETMSALEDFMQKSGIAQYCREICKGECCGTCWSNLNKTSCKVVEKGRRLACTAFICGKLFDSIGFPFESQERSNWLTSKAKINIAAEPYLVKAKRWSDNPPNPYFDPPNLLKIKEHFRVLEADVLLFFNAEMATKIYEKIQGLINKKQKVSYYA